MTIALDLGTHSFRSVRVENGSLRARRVRAAYCVLSDSDLHRRLLERTQTPFLGCDGGLVVLGDAAVHISRLVQCPVAELLPEGHLPHDDPFARQIVQVVLGGLLPPADSAGSVCGLIAPPGLRRPALGAADFLLREIRRRGYAPSLVSAGQALALAELAADRFSGIAVVAGHASTEITGTHLGQELCSWSVPRGGRWIDEQMLRERGIAAIARGHEVDLSAVVLEKEGLASAVVSPVSRDEQVLGRLCRELAWDIADQIVHKLADPRCGPLPRPTSVVCGGGTARIPGFCDLLEEALRRRESRASVRSVRRADDSPYTIARGGLIHADLESQAAHRASA